MSETLVVWWLMFHMGGVYNSPVFVPAPYASEKACETAGEVFKASPLDRMEHGQFVCVPGEPAPNDEGEGK